MMFSVKTAAEMDLKGFVSDSPDGTRKCGEFTLDGVKTTKMDSVSMRTLANCICTLADEVDERNAERA